MSLSIALRSSGSTSSHGVPSSRADSIDTKHSNSSHLNPTNATAAASSSIVPAVPKPLHYFPLPRAPLWRRLVLTGSVLPPSVSGHTLTLINHARTAILFGGATEAAEYFIIDLTRTEANEWRVLVGGPRQGGSSEMNHSCRIGHAAIPLDEHSMYVSGGWNGTKYVTSGVVLDLSTLTYLFEQNSSVPPASPRLLPPPRRDHGLARVSRHSFVLFGGWDGEDALGDLWICHLGRVTTSSSLNPSKSSASPNQRVWNWSPLSTSGPAPSPRRGAAVVRLQGSPPQVLVFGGLEGFSTYKNDAYVLDINTQTWTALTGLSGPPPPPRAWSACIPISNDFVLVYGGASIGGFLSDLHLLDIKVRRWYPIVQSSPAPSPRASCAFTRIGSSLLIHGGLTVVNEGGRQQVKLNSECWILETFLPPNKDNDAHEEGCVFDTDSDEDEENDPIHSLAVGKSPAALSTKSISPLRASRASYSTLPKESSSSIPIPSTHPQPQTATAPIAPPIDQILESWLGITSSGIGSNPSAGASHRDNASPTPSSTSSAHHRSALSISGGTPRSLALSGINGPWSRRLVRLEKHTLSLYAPDDGLAFDLCDGQLTEWSDVHAGVTANEDQRAVPQDSIDAWLIGGEGTSPVTSSPTTPTTSISIAPGQSLTQQSYDPLLRRLLDSSESIHPRFMAWLEGGGSGRLPSDLLAELRVWVLTHTTQHTSESMSRLVPRHLYDRLIDLMPRWIQSAQRATQPMRTRSGAHGGGFTLKTTLDEADRDEPTCKHCLLKFTSRTTEASILLSILSSHLV